MSRRSPTTNPTFPTSPATADFDVESEQSSNSATTGSSATTSRRSRVGAKAQRTDPAERSFGVQDRPVSHYFALLLPADESEEVLLVERFVADRSVELLKSRLPRRVWDTISRVVGGAFASRLIERGQPAGSWGLGENVLSVHFGWELTLLFWALEDATDSSASTAYGNWAAFAPEERWWLYHTVNTNSFQADMNRDRGWRKAIRVAFSETPTDLSESGLGGPARRNPALGDLRNASNRMLDEETR